jgi:DNA-binding transcriptional MerR regulator
MNGPGPGARSAPSRRGAKAGAGKIAPIKSGTAKPAAAWASATDLFRDGKDSVALRTIGEVARALGLRQHVLRYWEDQFPMLRPLTRAGGRRYYRPEDIALVAEIDRLLHREGYTIRGARQALGKPPAKSSAQRAAPIPRDTAVPLLDAMEAPEPDPAVEQSRLVELGLRADIEPAVALIDALDTLRDRLESIRERLGDALSEV